MKEPFFSVIIPTYNRAAVIGKAVESVLTQEYLDFEVIIVDDGSSDNTEQVIKTIEDHRIRYFKKENEERGAARNFGVKNSRGKYVCFLDSDDIYYPNHLSEAFKFIQNKSDVAFFYQPFEIQLLNGRKVKPAGFKRNIALTQIADHNSLCPIGAFIKAEIAGKYPFDPDPKFNFAEDLYVWLKLGIRYGIEFNKSYTSCLIHHKGRSMENVDPERLKYCTEKLVELLSDDDEFKQQPKLIGLVHASHLSLCSLYYSISGQKLKSLHFFLKSLFLSFNTVFRKRTLVIWRNILFKW